MVVYSENESNCFNLKVGRYDVQSIDPNVLEEAIKTHQYDIVRIRTSANDEFASQKLSLLNYPSYFNGGVRRYKVNVWDAPLPSIEHKELEFELYLGKEDQKISFETALRKTWQNNPIGYYKTPQINKLIDKEKEIKALVNYYLSNYNNQVNPKNFIYLLKENNNLVGFFALNIKREENLVDSTIAGILPSYQNNHYFIDLLRFIRKFTQQQKLKYFICGARNENIKSQMAFEKEYMKGYNVEYIFHLVCLKSQKLKINIIT